MPRATATSAAALAQGGKKKRTAAALKSATATSAAAPKRARAEAPGNTRSPVLGKLEAAALAEGDDEDPVAKAFRVDLLRKHHVACLRPGLRGYAAWMNDEVLNFVLHARLLQSRLDTEGGDAEAPAWVHSTLFYSKLMQEGYKLSWGAPVVALRPLPHHGPACPPHSD